MRWPRRGASAPAPPSSIASIPWSAVLRIPTGDGTVWMKASAPTTAFEVPMYAVLARVAPERILIPIAADPERAWLLLPDGGSAPRRALR